MGLMEARSGENGFDSMLIYRIGNKSVGKREEKRQSRRLREIRKGFQENQRCPCIYRYQPVDNDCVAKSR